MTNEFDSHEVKLGHRGRRLLAEIAERDLRRCQRFQRGHYVTTDARGRMEKDSIGPIADEWTLRAEQRLQRYINV